MLIEKSIDHESFYCKSGIVYEKRKNRKPLKIRTLNFHYPDKDFLTEDHINYLNTHYNYHQRQKITNTGDQIELF